MHTHRDTHRHGGEGGGRGTTRTLTRHTKQYKTVPLLPSWGISFRSKHKMSHMLKIRISRIAQQTHTHAHTNRQKQRERERDRQTDRQTEKHARWHAIQNNTRQWFYCPHAEFHWAVNTKYPICWRLIRISQIIIIIINSYKAPLFFNQS